MGLKEELFQASVSLVKREKVTLPMSGKTVQVRGLMAEELIRLNNTKEEHRVTVQTCLALEHPDTNEPLLNVNDINDRKVVGALHGLDLLTISDAVDRLSGMGKEAEEQGKGISSSGEKSLTISSPAGSESPSANSVPVSAESNA